MFHSSRFASGKATFLCSLVSAYCASAGQANATPTPTALAMTSFPSPAGEHVFIYSWTFARCLEQYVCSDSGCWQNNCLQESNGVSPAEGTRITGYYTANDNTDHVFFLSWDGHIHEWYWADDGGVNGGVSDLDLTARTGYPPAQGSYISGISGGGIGNPSSLTGFFDGNVAHVFYVDTSRVLRELYRNSGGWWGGNISIQANAVNGNGLSSLWDGSCQHVYFTAWDNNLYENYACGPWQSHPLSGPSGAISPQIAASQAPAGYLASYVYSNGSQAIWGPQSDSNGLRVALYPPWGSGALTNGYVPNLTPSSPMVSVWNLAHDSNPEPFYVGTGGLIYEPNTSVTPLQTQNSGNPHVRLTANNTKLSEITGFVDSANTSHIFYVGTDGDIHEYYQISGQSTWNTNRLSTNAHWQ